MPYIPDAYTDSAPAAAVLGRRLYVAFKGHDSDHIYLASTDDPANASRWHIVDVGEIRASPASTNDEPAQIRTSHGPALTAVDDHLWLAFKGHNNSLIWLIALRELVVGTYELRRFGHLKNAQTAQGPAAAGPEIAPLAVIAGMSRFPMVVYRGDRDDGVWNHIYMSPHDSDDRLAGTHTEFAPAAAFAELRSQDAHFVAYTDRTSEQVRFMHDFRSGRPGMPPGWSHPEPVPYALTSNKPGLAVHDDVLYLAFKSRNADDYQIWISSWDDFWVAHGSIPDAYSDQGPALASFRSSLYIVYKGHNNNRIWYSPVPVSRRNVRTTIVVSLGGASTGDIHNVVEQCAEAHGYPLKPGVNWSQSSGDIRADTADAARIRDTINRLTSRNGGDKRLLSLLVVGKSAGGVLAWNTFKRHFVSQISSFHRAALVLVDPHGRVQDDDRADPYCGHQDLWWPDTWPSDRDVFRVYDIFQHRDTLAGAAFPDSRVYRNIRLSDGDVDHWNITGHARTRELITEALSFALAG